MAAGGEGRPKQEDLTITVGPLLQEDTTKPNMAAGAEGRPKQFQFDLYYKKTPQTKRGSRRGRKT